MILVPRKYNPICLPHSVGESLNVKASMIWLKPKAACCIKPGSRDGGPWFLLRAEIKNPPPIWFLRLQIIIIHAFPRKFQK